MRELKFRAWSNEYDHYCSGLEYDSDFGWEGILDSEFECQRDLDPLVELYTGLNDKNGKEIYVGDIVRAEDIPKKTYEIIWDDDLAVMMRDCHDRRWEVFQVPLEVIGNIHMNPELLEEEA